MLYVGDKVKEKQQEYSTDLFGRNHASEDMKKGTEEPKELEALIKAAILKLKCGYRNI